MVHARAKLTPLGRLLLVQRVRAQGWSAKETAQLRTVATAANRQPAVAGYVRRPGDSEYRALGLDVLRLEGDLVIEITRFVNADLFAAFGLQSTL